MIELTKDESQIVYLAKHHYTSPRTVGIKILYKKIYQYDFNYEGCYHMVSDLFFKIWQERGSLIRDIEVMMNDSLPSNNWKVGGKGKMLWNRDTRSFNDSQTHFARTLAMLSYIALTEIKFIKLVPKSEIEHYLTLS